ncbi:MAG: fumarate hydratase, partial [bacterium]
MAVFRFQEMFELGEDSTPYRKLTDQHVSTIEVDGRTILKVEPEALSMLSGQAIRDVSHLFRPSHLAQLAKILEDPEASANDRIVALELLKNATISSEMILPSCQDTGTAIAVGKKGQDVFTGFDDEEALSYGIYQTYASSNLRYSQMAALSMYDEKNTGTNLPAQIELYATKGN